MDNFQLVVVNGDDRWCVCCSTIFSFSTIFSNCLKKGFSFFWGVVKKTGAWFFWGV